MFTKKKKLTTPKNIWQLKNFYITIFYIILIF